MTTSIDPFFGRVNSGAWNACVGKQGDAQNYVDGYLEAALELANAVLDENRPASRDTLVMPILYNCRHGLELSLKYAINRLHTAGMITHTHPPDHDIASHWNHLHEKAVGGVSALGDATLRQIILDIKPYVDSLAAIDDDGQELRYAENREGETSLKGISIIDLQHVRDSIEKLTELLQRLKNRIHDIEEERSTNSFTSNCSRGDLIEIAAMVGDQSTWVENSFLDKREQVMQRFGLSKGKFSDALDIIKKAAPLAILIGHEASLVHLTDSKALEILTLWVKENPRMTQEQFDNPGMNLYEFDFDRMIASTNKSDELDKTLSNLLSFEEFADLETVYYLGRNKEFGEHYQLLLSYTISSYGKTLSNENIKHITSKTNLLDFFADGCDRIGRPSLATSIRSLSPKITYTIKE